MPQVIDANVEIYDGTAVERLFDANGLLTVDLEEPEGSQVTFPWKEYVGAGYAQGYVYGQDGSQATFTMDCLWRDWLSGRLQREILGYAYVTPGTPAALARWPPMEHPGLYGLHATRITNVEGIQLLGRWADWPVAYYRYARLTILFQRLPYRILTDAQLVAAPYSGKEYRRWTSRQNRGSAEVLTRPAPSWYWAQGPMAATPQGRAPVSGSTPERVSQELLKFTWHDVPAEALFGRVARTTPLQPNLFEGQPFNIYNGLGRVNNAPFLGKPKETLLLDSVDFEERVQPVTNETVYLHNQDPCLRYNVVFNLLYKDPPAFDPAVARGHNVFPPPANAGTNLWALLVRSKTAGPLADGSDRPFGWYDFEQLFKPSVT